MVRSRLAPVPPCPSVLPPGAGNQEAKKAVETGKKRAQETKGRYVIETGVRDGHLDAPAVRRDDDGDVAAIPTVEQTQCRLRGASTAGLDGGAAQSTGVILIAQAARPLRTPSAMRAHARGMPAQGFWGGAGNDETAGQGRRSRPPDRARGDRSVPALSGADGEGHGRQERQRSSEARQDRLHFMTPLSLSMRRLLGSRAVFVTEDPWLCVLASRRVCPGRWSGGDLSVSIPTMAPASHLLDGPAVPLGRSERGSCGLAPAPRAVNRPLAGIETTAGVRRSFQG